MKGWLVRLGLILAGAAMLTGCAPQSVGVKAGSTPTPIPTSIAVEKPAFSVQRGEVVRQVSFTGRIVPVEEAELFFRAGGRVRTILVKQGDRVTAGQILADLEMPDLERQLVAAQSELEAAKRQLDFDTQRAEANLEIAKLTLEMLKDQGANQDQLSIQELRVQLAQIDLDELHGGIDPRLTSQVEDLQASISEGQIIAPMTGQVLSISLTEGYAVDAFKPVVIVADPSRLEASADLQETQLQGLAQGMLASVALISRPGQEIPGEVRQVPYPGSGTNSSVAGQSTRVTLSTSSSVAGYTLGELVRITVILEKKPDALWLPPQAIRKFEGRRFVIVQQGKTQARVDVKVGIEAEDCVEILDGLSEGQVVVAP